MRPCRACNQAHDPLIECGRARRMAEAAGIEVLGSPRTGDRRPGEALVLAEKPVTDTGLSVTPASQTVTDNRNGHGSDRNGQTNAERQRAYRLRHQDRVRAVDRERKRLARS